MLKIALGLAKAAFKRFDCDNSGKITVKASGAGKSSWINMETRAERPEEF